MISSPSLLSKRSAAMLLAVLAFSAFADVDTAMKLPGEVEKGASFLEALGRGKYVMVSGGLAVLFMGWRIYTGKTDLSAVISQVIGIVIIFFAFPSAYGIYALANGG